MIYGLPSYIGSCCPGFVATAKSLTECSQLAKATFGFAATLLCPTSCVLAPLVLLPPIVKAHLSWQDASCNGCSDHMPLLLPVGRTLPPYTPVLHCLSSLSSLSSITSFHQHQVSCISKASNAVRLDYSHFCIHFGTTRIPYPSSGLSQTALHSHQPNRTLSTPDHGLAAMGTLCRLFDAGICR